MTETATEKTGPEIAIVATALAQDRPEETAATRTVRDRATAETEIVTRIGTDRAMPIEDVLGKRTAVVIGREMHAAATIGSPVPDIEMTNLASDRHSNPRRSASPPRSPAKLERGAHNSPLPTRSKPNEKGSGASLSFKVGKQDDDHGRGRAGKGKGSSDYDTPEYDGRHGEFDGDRKATPESGGDPMDEDDDLVVEDDGLSAMQAMMGFGGFGTTKGTKVIGNNVGAVRKAKKTEYRQYMNRIGGFNRPLSPSR
ncbi:hypothetical protein F4809DRAFT_666798 [Biscogniauxia mediterranea]|nr:hypothetical protein F4809DRAFT_666798 [Biscogniauxia mediterranea]